MEFTTAEKDLWLVFIPILIILVTTYFYLYKKDKLKYNPNYSGSYIVLIVLTVVGFIMPIWISVYYLKYYKKDIEKEKYWKQQEILLRSNMTVTDGK